MSITNAEVDILKTIPLKDAEASTGIRRHVLRQCINDGKLPGYVFAGGRQIRVVEKDLAKLLVRLKVVAKDESEPSRSSITAAARAAMAAKRRSATGEPTDDD